MELNMTGFPEEQLLPEGYQFNLSDFALFLSVMKNKDAYENTLSIILDEPDLKLAEVEVEQVVLNESGKRAIRLDAWTVWQTGSLKSIKAISTPIRRIMRAIWP